MIKLKEGQKVLDEQGNVYLVEQGDTLYEKSRPIISFGRNTILTDYNGNEFDVSGYSYFVEEDIKFINRKVKDKLYKLETSDGSYIIITEDEWFNVALVNGNIK